jgi:hypothetical protein
VVLLAVAAVILIGVVAVAVGRGGELDPAETDYRPVDLDEVTSTDVALMRPPTALFGYHRESTDVAFGQIARAISDREVEIATLRRQLAEQLPVRTSPALRADPSLRPEPLAPESAFGTGPRPDTTGPVTKAGPPTRPPARLPAEAPARLPDEPLGGPPAGGQWQATRAQGPGPEPSLPPRPVSSWPPPATTKAGSLLPEPMPNSSMPHTPWTVRDQAQGPGPDSPAVAPGTSLPSGSTQPPGPLPARPAPSRPAPSRSRPSGAAASRPATSAAARPAEPASWPSAAPAAPATSATPGAPGAQGTPGTAAGSHGPDQGALPSRPSVLHRELADRPAAPEPGAEADPWLVWQRRTDYPTGPAGADDAATDPGEQT